MSDPVTRPPYAALDRRALVVAGALLGLAALVTAVRLPVAYAASAGTSLAVVPAVLSLVAVLASSVALWLVGGRRGICAGSSAGRIALRAAAVVQLVVGVAVALPTGAAFASRPVAALVVVLSVVGAVAALVGAVLAARSGGLPGVAGRALVPWAVVALVRVLLFSTAAGLSLVLSLGGGWASVGVQVLVVVTLLVAAVTWLVVGLRREGTAASSALPRP